MEQKPSVGRIVHYVAYGTPGGEFPSGVCRAAIITEVEPSDINNADADGTRVGLCVLNPTGQYFNRGIPYNDGAETPGDPSCPTKSQHGNPFRYCSCGWIEAHHKPGTWHWPERT